jgi:hypothetical protein
VGVGVGVGCLLLLVVLLPPLVSCREALVNEAVILVVSLLL